MAHPIDNTNEYLVSNELRFARLLSDIIAVTGVDIVDEVAKRANRTPGEITDTLARAEKVWMNAKEVAEADKLLEDLRDHIGRGDGALAEARFEELDNHMKAGKQPPQEWKDKQ